MNKLLHMLPPWFHHDRWPGRTIAKCRRGATAVEYALIAALIVIALVGAVQALRDSLIALPMERIQNAIAAVLA